MKIINVYDSGAVIPVAFYGLDDASAKEAAAYVDYVKARVQTPLKALEVISCPDGKVDVKYSAYGTKFERIRRITGYLVGTIDRWNDAKKVEERERVKHDRRYFND